MNNQLQWKYEKALAYEIFVKEEYWFAKDVIKKSNCIFDIWWHIWLFSKRCRELNKNVVIHYFEPIKQFYEKALEGFIEDKNIVLNNYWISYKNEKSEMFLNETKSMQTSKYHSFLNKDWKLVDVNFITLREYLWESKINKIDLLKMDVEGMEFEILTSWWNLEIPAIENLIIEVHLLNDDMKNQRETINDKLNDYFNSIEIINSDYTKNIFLVWARK